MTNEQRQRGQMERLKGSDRYYGCHFGMRSTLERDRADFFHGWDEVDAALTSSCYEQSTVG